MSSREVIDNIAAGLVEPLNISLAEAGRRLAANQTVRIHIEPGDATRYEFFLLPMSDRNLQVQGTNEEHLMVAIYSPSRYGVYPVRVPYSEKDIGHTGHYLAGHMFIGPDVVQGYTCFIIVATIWAIRNARQS